MSQAFFTPFPSEGSGGGGGGGGSPEIAGKQQVTVDFGFSSGKEGDLAVATVSAGWVTNGMLLFCQIAPDSTPDHDQEDAAVEGITAYVTNVQAGVGFDVVAQAPRGSWGRYKFNVMGLV
jgi:hypothetical protein